MYRACFWTLELIMKKFLTLPVWRAFNLIFDIGEKQFWWPNTSNNSTMQCTNIQCDTSFYFAYFCINGPLPWQNALFRNTQTWYCMPQSKVKKIDSSLTWKWSLPFFTHFCFSENSVNFFFKSRFIKFFFVRTFFRWKFICPWEVIQLPRKQDGMVMRVYITYVTFEWGERKWERKARDRKRLACRKVDRQLE